MKYIIYSKDKENALPIRKENREAHLEFLHHRGPVKVLSAGPWLGEDGETMKGSLIIVEADKYSTVQRWLANDPYGKAGLPESVTIHPFIWAIGGPKEV
jgi:uncharacterized protein YciI